jgi:hypothetical protein
LKKESKPRATKNLEDKQGEPQRILVTTDGSNIPSLQGYDKNDQNNDQECNESCHENKQPKEAIVLRNGESLSMPDNLLEGEVEFMIPREQFNELHRVMEECNDFCYLTFDVKDKMFLRAESDMSR